ncbi:MAG TPA: hypothetical protein VLW55_07600 [Burkholderiaceae bacterium]|nr:hypothetical protein [Burkholderiaceae bacterium]
MDQSNVIDLENIGSDKKRRAERKLTLKVDVIRTLSDSEMNQVAGAWIRPPLSWSCPQPSASGCCPKTE